MHDEHRTRSNTVRKTTHELRLAYGQRTFTAAELTIWLATLPADAEVRGLLALKGHYANGETHQFDGLQATVEEGPVAEPTDLKTPFVFCPSHQPVQHRDGKAPWCHACGRTATGHKPTSRFDRKDTQ